MAFGRTAAPPPRFPQTPGKDKTKHGAAIPWERESMPVFDGD